MPLPLLVIHPVHSTQCPLPGLYLPWCSGLAGPDTSSSEDEDEALGSSDDDDDDEGGAGGRAAARGLAGPSSEDDEGGSEEDEEGSEEEGFQGRQPLVALGGGEEEEPLNEQDLEEWGIGALAANPEEQVRHSCPWGMCLCVWLGA